MTTDSQLAAARRKTRRRLGFSAVHLVLYFSFSLNWTPASTAIQSVFGVGSISGSIIMFVLLVLAFIALEFLFLRVERESKA